MKPVLGLPGRNHETESWMTALLTELGCAGAEVARYDHWRSGGDPDIGREAGRHPVAGRELVVAKSMGTMVLLASAAQGAPARAVLIGTPIGAYPQAQVQALQALIGRLPCLFIQQKDDFTGTAAALQAVVGDSAELRVIAGSDHVYADVAELAGLIRRWQDALDG